MCPSRRHTNVYLSCAWGYGNEGEVAVGIKASGVPRKDIWITSKLFELHHRPEHVEMACRDTLEKLGTDYLDMYLMHYPVSLGWRVSCVTRLMIRSHGRLYRPKVSFPRKSIRLL